jgi:hypothetical protein
MKADEVQNRLALFAVEFQAGKKGIGQLNALRDVIFGAAGLAGVMEQQGEQKQVQAVDLGD